MNLCIFYLCVIYHTAICTIFMYDINSRWILSIVCSYSSISIAWHVTNKSTWWPSYDQEVLLLIIWWTQGLHTQISFCTGVQLIMGEKVHMYLPDLRCWAGAVKHVDSHSTVWTVEMLSYYVLPHGVNCHVDCDTLIQFIDIEYK